jgi:hypothetical protein
VSVRLSADDLELLKAAGEAMWPQAPVSNSALVLSLAKMKAQEILAGSGHKRR